jgi:hypothetical protein
VGVGARSDVAVRGDWTAASGVARSCVGDLGGGGQRRTPRVANEAIVAGKFRGAEGRGPPARGFGRQDLAEEPEAAGWGWGICRFGFGGLASRSIGFDGGKITVGLFGENVVFECSVRC